MLYHLLHWLEVTYQPPGFQVFNFITVRASLAAGTALLDRALRGEEDHPRSSARRQLGETIREGEDAGAVSHAHKAGTPTMGGVIILLALCGATLLWGDLTNPYVLLILLATVWMGAIGFADDYIKVVKKNKQGVNEWVKIGGQIALGLFLGAMLYWLPTLRETNTLTSLPFIADGTFDYDFLSADRRLRHRLADLHPHRHLHRHRRLERRQPHRRARRADGGHERVRRHWPHRALLHHREYQPRRLRQRHLPPAARAS